MVLGLLLMRLEGNSSDDKAVDDREFMQYRNAKCGLTWNTWCQQTDYLEIGINRRGHKFAINRCGLCRWACQVPKKDWHRFKNREQTKDYRCKECDAVGCKSCMPSACRTCGSYQQIELHHWLPRHLVSAMDDDPSLERHWPTDYLCRSCHMDWHRIVTPNMCRGEDIA